MGTFLKSVELFKDTALENADKVIRATGLKMLARVIERSPVGNPDTWKANARLQHAKRQTAIDNALLRKQAKNITKNGRLRKGLKKTAGVQITFVTKKGKRVQFMQRNNVAPKGYTGGRFRGNWQVSFNTPVAGETGRIDKSGSDTLSRGGAVLAGFNASTTTAIYFTNNVPYAVRLEFGWSKQAPQGMVRITAREFQKLFNEALRENK